MPAPLLGTLGKVALGGAKKIATDKLLNRKKKTDARRAAAQKVMGGEESVEVTGGALAVIPKASLVPSPAGAITKFSGNQQSGGGEDLQGLVLRIKTSVISVESLLGNSVALQKKKLDDERKAREAEELAKSEKELEKKKPKTASKGLKLNLPGKGLISTVMDFITNVAFGWLAVRLVKFAPQIGKVLPFLGRVLDFVINVGGIILDGFITLVDWGYKLFEMGRGLVKNVFGEEGAKKFDTFMNSIKNLITGFLVWKIIGQKIFKTLVGNIKNTFNVIKGIFSKAGKVLNFLTGGRAGNLAKNVLGKGGKLLGNIGRRLGVGAKRFAGKGVRSLVKGAGKTGSSIMKKGVGKAAKRAVIKMFGKTAGKIFGKIPIIGPVIVGIVSLLSGEPIGQAIFKTFGAAIGGLLGTFIPIPVVGTLLGEAVGVFVGDLLYHLIVKRDPKAAFKMLKDTVMGIFKGGKAIFNWITGGFGRFYKGIPKIKIPDFPEDPPGVMSKVPFAGRVWKGLKKVMKVMLGPIGFLMGKEIPNLLWMTDPMNTVPLLFKSLFSSGGEDTASAPPPPSLVDGKDSKAQTPSLVDSKDSKAQTPSLVDSKDSKARTTIKGDLTTITFDGKTYPRGLSGPVGQTFGGKGGSTYKAPTIVKSNKSIGNKISSVSKKASYEKHHHQIVQVPIVVKSKGVEQTTSTQPIGSSSGGGGDDPYEVLDFQG